MFPHWRCVSSSVHLLSASILPQVAISSGQLLLQSTLLNEIQGRWAKARRLLVYQCQPLLTKLKCYLSCNCKCKDTSSLTQKHSHCPIPWSGQHMHLKVSPIHGHGAICSIVIWRFEEEISCGFLLIQVGGIEWVQMLVFFLQRPTYSYFKNACSF